MLEQMSGPPEVRRLPAALAGVVLLLCGFWVPGCQTETKTVRGDERPTRNTPSSRGAIAAPQELHDISGFLLKHLILHDRMPETLEQLRAEGIMPAEGYAHLDEYAYGPDGIGALRDGRVIILVDRSERIESHLWCILREPADGSRTVTLSVSPVPITHLQAAARRAG